MAILQWRWPETENSYSFCADDRAIKRRLKVCPGFREHGTDPKRCRTLFDDP
jgi:hypothetical protein